MQRVLYAGRFLVNYCYVTMKMCWTIKITSSYSTSPNDIFQCSCVDNETGMLTAVSMYWWVWRSLVLFPDCVELLEALKKKQGEMSSLRVGKETFSCRKYIENK